MEGGIEGENVCEERERGGRGWLSMADMDGGRD